MNDPQDVQLESRPDGWSRLTIAVSYAWDVDNMGNGVGPRAGARSIRLRGTSAIRTHGPSPEARLVTSTVIRVPAPTRIVGGIASPRSTTRLVTPLALR